MKVPFLDLTSQYEEIAAKLKRAAEDVLKSGKYILADNVAEFEREIAAYTDTHYALGVASGTDALKIALKAAGVQRGDEVITTPFTYIATSEAIIELGAKPVFADIEEEFFNMDISKAEAALTHKTRAILPVHLFGRPLNMDDISRLADGRNLGVIEDCAQAFGARFKHKHVGSFGDAGIFSFFPTKNLGGYGDAGMIVTNDKDIYEKIKILRVHGATGNYQHVLNGYNSRLDELQAALLRVKLKHIDGWLSARKKIAGYYQERLSVLRDIIKLPHPQKDEGHSYNVYTIATERRDELKKYLEEHEVATMIYYPIPLHLQEVYSNLGYKKGSLPVAEAAAQKVLSLPIFPELSRKQQDYVADSIIRFFKK